MKIILTLSQLKHILETEQLKYPITFKQEDFNAKEFKEFHELLQSKERV
jgi:hypothetical protein